MFSIGIILLLMALSIDDIPQAQLITSSGGGGTPGGSNTQFQYNNSGAFGGTPNLTLGGSTIVGGLDLWMTGRNVVVEKFVFFNANNAVTLANGNNINITVNSSYNRITGPSAVFNVNCITPPQNAAYGGASAGEAVVLYNAVAFAMTIKNEDTTNCTTAANRIKTLTGADVTLRSGTSAATFYYDGTDARWILTGTN